MSSKKHPLQTSSPRPEPDRSGQVQVWLDIDGLGLVVQTPEGRELKLSPDYVGLKNLLAVAKHARALREGLPIFTKPGLTPAQLAAAFSPEDYIRACHCGKAVTPFMERCDGCPGASGAGKIQKFDARGRAVVTLADLGL